MGYPKYQLPAWYKPDYSYLEKQITILEGRAKKIRENPDPTKLQANAIVYEGQAVGMKKELEAWKAGEPFVHSVVGVAGLMGLRVVPITPDRWHLWADDFFRTSRGVGYPDMVCDRFQVAAGMWRSGALPPPSFVEGLSCYCDIEMQEVIAELYDFPGCPSYMADRFVEPRGEPLGYLVGQIREMAEAIREAIPEARPLTDDVLRNYLERTDEAQRRSLVVWEAAKQVPCPLKGKDIISGLGGGGGGVFAREYYEKRDQELKTKVANKFSAVGEEKARCMWLVSNPFFYDALAEFEARGVSIPIWEYELTCRLAGQGVVCDTAEHGRKLSPLEEYARREAMAVWAGPAERWVDQVMEHIKEFKIDMLCYYMLSGCPTCTLPARQVADQAEKEFGIPTLFLDGFMMDQERMSREDVHNKINEFVDIAFARKGIKG